MSEDSFGRAFSRRQKEITWWSRRMSEAVKKENTVWREQFKNRAQDSYEKWKKLRKGSEKNWNDLLRKWYGKNFWTYFQNIIKICYTIFSKIRGKREMRF